MTAFLGFVYGLRANQGMLNKVLARSRNSTIGEAFDQAVAWERDHGSRTSSLELMGPLQVNMVSAVDKEQQRKDVAANPALALVSAVQANNPKDGDPMSAAILKLMAQIQSLGDRVEKRFNVLDNRIRNLEKPATRGYRSGGFRGGYSNDRRQNNYDNGDRRDRYESQPNVPNVQVGADGRAERRENQNDGRRTGGGDYRPRGRGRGRGYYNRSS